MIANFSAAVTGLEMAQRALQVTGQNITNVNTEGYVRRRAEFVDSHSAKIGMSGTSAMQVGAGVDIRCIRQIRNTLLDQSYRDDNSKYNYYKKEYEVYKEVEELMINSTDLCGALDDLYGAISTLSTDPSSVSAKAQLVVTAQNFVYEAQYISEQLSDMQSAINEQINDEVNKANNLIQEIFYLNENIAKLEISEDEASDLRDQRNVALDNLSAIIPITVTEQDNGKVQIYTCGRDLYTVGTYETMYVKATGTADGFITPMWLKAGDEVVKMERPISEDACFQDGGTLKGLLMARGNVQPNYTTSDKDTELYTIPRIKKQLDKLVNSVVTTINEAFAPKSHVDGPYGADGSQYVELFSRKSMDRYSLVDGVYRYNEEDPENYDSLYTVENLVVNPYLLKQSNYNSLCTSKSGEEGDNSLLHELLQGFNTKSIVSSKGNLMTYSNFAVDFLSDLANKSGTSKSNMEHNQTLCDAVDQERQDVDGVSMDEELSSLIRFQHSYSASARVINTLDSMIQTVIMSMGV